MSKHLIYWQGQRVCDALFCFILSVEISQTTLLHAVLFGIFVKLLMNRGASRLFGVTL
jgi:hypothetical protein